MQEITGEFASQDGLMLFERRWFPETAAKAAVILVHGYSEHSGRRQAMAGPLVDAGYAVHMYDLRGHGRSQGPRAFVRSFSEHLDDLQQFFQRTRKRCEGLPLFVAGHSMGGLIAACWALQHDASVRGLILSAAALKIDGHAHAWLHSIAGVVSATLPRLPTIRLDETAISRVPEVVQAYRDDPLVYHGRMPARTGAELLHSTQSLAARYAQFSLPLLLLHGTADRLTDPDGSRRLYEQATSADKTLFLYPGVYHELWQEPERERAIADLIGWLQERN